MRPGIFSVESLEQRTLFSGTLCLPGVTPTAPNPAPAPAKPAKPNGNGPSAATPIGVYFGSYMRTDSALAEPEYGAFKLIVNKARGGLFGVMEINSETEGLISRTAPLVLKSDGKFRVFFFSAKLVMRLEGQLDPESGVIQSKFHGLKRSASFRADVNLVRSESIVNGQ